MKKDQIENHVENITITQQNKSNNKKEQIEVINIEKDNRFI